MYNAIIYKEWIKTRKVIGLLAIIFTGVGLFSFMKMGEEIRSAGMALFWETIIQKDVVLFPYFEYLPLLAGFLLAITQYVPELQFKRLKLTLHLPLPENRIVFAMLAYGFSVALTFIVLSLPLLLLGLSLSFPSEIVWASFGKILPWFLAGPASYLLTAWICLEPQWKQRILNAMSGIVALSFFFIKAKSGAYLPFIPFLTVFIILAFAFSYYSKNRFKEGIQ
jgi:hypothetical protein